MKSIKIIVTLSAFGLALISSAMAADPVATPAIPPTPNADSSPSDSGKPASPGSQISDEVKAAIDAANKMRADFIKKQQDLRSNLEHASKDERAQIRESLQTARDEFLTAQRDARTDIKKKIAELKAQLKQHQDVIDAAKDEAKTKVHARKDG